MNAHRAKLPTRWIALLIAALLLPAEAFAQQSDAFTEALARGPLYAAAAALIGGCILATRFVARYPRPGVEG